MILRVGKEGHTGQDVTRNLAAFQQEFGLDPRSRSSSMLATAYASGCVTWNLHSRNRIATRGRRTTRIVPGRR